MVVFGGFLKDKRTNDLLLYVFNENKWTRTEQRGKLPVARSNHSSVIHNNKLITFGGCDVYNQKLNDTWIFDLKKEIWSELKIDHEPEFGIF